MTLKKKVEAVDSLIARNPKVDKTVLNESIELIAKLRGLGFSRHRYNLASPFERRLRPMMLSRSTKQTDRNACHCLPAQA